MPKLTQEDANDLAEHLRQCWPLVLNDQFKHDVANECIDFLNDRTTDGSE